MPASSLPSLRSTGHAARLAIAVLAVLLILLNGAGWWLAVRLIRTQEDLVGRGLEQSAEYAAGIVPPGNLYFLEAAWNPETSTTDFATIAQYAELPSLLALQSALARTAERLGPRTGIALLSPDGWLAMDAKGLRTEAERPRDYEEDAALVARAAAGELASNRRDRADATKRAYVPLRNDDGDVIGILRLENRSLEGFPRDKVIRRLTLGAVLGTALIVSLWWMLTRLLGNAIRTERVAQQGDRLRALGTATAGIAHEIRNPLGIILLATEEITATARGIADEKTRAAMEQLARDVRDEAKRLSRLTDDFLGLARDRPVIGDAPAVDMGESAEQTARVFAKGLPPAIKLAFEGAGEPLPVAFDVARLRQVLLNLLRNSQEAIAGEGRIVVRAARRKDDAVLEVADTGPGMDAATLARVFDPFFTTRAEGTGLGLSVSRTLVEAAGGRLEIESEPGKGTTARLTLPVAK